MLKESMKEAEENKALRKSLQIYLERQGHGSLKRISDKIDVTPETIKRYLKGNNPKLSTWEAIREFLFAQGFYHTPPHGKNITLTEDKTPYPAVSNPDTPLLYWKTEGSPDHPYTAKENPTKYHPETEDPMAAPDPIDRLSITLKNASLMLRDNAPTDVKLDLLEQNLAYCIKTLIPAARKKED